MIETIKNLVEITAILVAGWWTYRAFIHGRISYPKAKGVLAVTSLRLHDDRQLVRVTLGIENVGTSILQISRFFARLQQIDPPATRSGVAFEPRVHPDTFEIPWPLIGEYNYDRPKIFREIEPGESDALNFDFVIPGDVRCVYVNCYIQNRRKRTRIDWKPGRHFIQHRNIGWEFASVHQLGADAPATTTAASASSPPKSSKDQP